MPRARNGGANRLIMSSSVQKPGVEPYMAGFYYMWKGNLIANYRYDTRFTRYMRTLSNDINRCFIRELNHNSV